MKASQLKKLNTERFIAAVNHLISEHKVKNQADLSRELGFAEESLSQMKKGKRGVTLELMSKIFTKFAVSPIFIFFGKGPIILDHPDQFSGFIDEPEGEYASENSELRAQNKTITAIIEGYMKQAEVNIKYTELLEKQVTELTARVNELEEKAKNIT